MSDSGQGPYAPIDYVSLCAALLDRAPQLVPAWLPGGTINGHEYVCADLSGGEGTSCSVNLNTGAWADFAGDERGRDLLSLYAAIRNLRNSDAARELMRDLGWERQAAAARASAPKAAEPAGPAPEPPPDDGTGPAPGPRRKSKWRALPVVPSHAPAPRFRWSYFDKQADRWVELEAVRTWEYAFEGQRFGYVARFERTNSEGEIVKDTLPLTWCVDESDDRGSCRWHWKMWESPRPLYVPATLLSGEPDRVPVVVVEGEKCAEAGHQLLGHEFDFISWPGGAKSWAHGRWSTVMGRTVILWPDVDAKRHRLSAAEREAGVDPSTKPLMPDSRQPGMAAMIGIGSLLLAEHGCTVHLCNVPRPDPAKDGWDIADAIAEGWDAERVRKFLRSASVFRPPDDAARAKAADGKSTPSTAGADPSDQTPAPGWRAKLLLASTGAIRPVRENITLALDGLVGEGVVGVPECENLIAWNEFTNDVIKLRDAPWGTKAGAWAEVDDLLMGEWLVREHWLPSVPRGTLEEAVRMVAYRHGFHPVRQYLQQLVWDGSPRLSTWIRRTCLVEDEWDDKEPLQQYLARAGTYYLMGMCQRVLEPGCKFDYMLVLESPEQGKGKSTLFRVLGGSWFADTGVVLGDKDSYQQLQGRWVYEMGELDALSKAEITKVKQYIASQSDYFRASFDRRAREYPRQVVFGGTTNDDQYLVDSSGNRRFWPVRVTRQVDLDWLRENRDQLFAEAVARLAAGKRFHPLPDEEKQFFVPQQEQRRVVGGIEEAIVAYLYDERQRVGVSGENGTLVTTISLNELLGRVGFSLDKQTDVVRKRAAAVMRRLGWRHVRSSHDGRPWVYRRPDSPADALAAGATPTFTQPDAAAQPEGADSDCPF